MTQDQDNSNRQSSNESSSLYEAAHNLVNAFNQYVWPQRAESNQLNISSSSSSNNNNSQAFVGTSFRNRYLVGNRQYSLVQDKGVQTDPIDMIIRDLKREDNKNEKNTLKLVEADHQRVISLENEITRMKKQLVLQGVSFHTPSSLGNQKVTKPRQPILAHSLAGARRVMPESGFVRSLYSPQANKTDDRHKITMQSIVKEIPKVKLRRTEMILGPGGELKVNQFWNEIYKTKRSWRSSISSSSSSSSSSPSSSLPLPSTSSSLALKPKEN